MGASALSLATRSARSGKAGIERGRRHEERALKAALRLPSWWLLGAWRTRNGSQLDRWGIDIVVDTVDLGRIMLQIKSNERDADRFRAHGRTLELRHRIHTIVINDSLCDAEVFGRVLGACIKAREEDLAAGLTCDDARLCRLEAA